MMRLNRKRGNNSVKGISQEVKQIEEHYKTWLEMSNLTEKEFIAYRNIARYHIMCGIDGNYTIVVIGKMNNEVFEKIGEQIAFETDNKEAMTNCCLFLLYLANKLDESNAVAPKFEQRGLYFTQITKDFIKNNIYSN